MATTDACLVLQSAAQREECPPETRLWIAVLEEALRNDPPEKVRRWLGSRDGQLVAWLAGVDPDWVSGTVLPSVQRGRRKPPRRLLKGPRQHQTTLSAA